jgi:hypothetical protein
MQLDIALIVLFLPTILQSHHVFFKIFPPRSRKLLFLLPHHSQHSGSHRPASRILHPHVCRRLFESFSTENQHPFRQPLQQQPQAFHGATHSRSQGDTHQMRQATKSPSGQPGSRSSGKKRWATDQRRTGIIQENTFSL